eukprot:5153077-Amphidinium_carterae.5
MMLHAEEIITKFGRVSRKIASEDDFSLLQYCDCVKRFLQDGLANFLMEHQARLVLIQFSSDSTPVYVRDRASVDVGDAGVVRRSGKRGVDFLVQFFHVSALKRKQLDQRIC